MSSSWLLESCVPAILDVLASGAVLLAPLLTVKKNKSAASSTDRPFFLKRRGFEIVLSLLLLLLVAVSALVLARAHRAAPTTNFSAATTPAEASPAPSGSSGSEHTLHLESRWLTVTLSLRSPAPDFTLFDLGTGKKVNFVRCRGSRPAVLVFGSASCDRLCKNAGCVGRLYEQHKDRVAFLFVHVTNASHPLPPAVVEAHNKFLGGKEGRIGRADQARIAADYFAFPFPCLLDGEDKQVENLYQAWPQRLVVLDAEGRIVCDFGRGLVSDWDFKEIERSLTVRVKHLPGAS